MGCEKYSGRLTDAVLGGLPPQSKSELRKHVAVCGACRENLRHAEAIAAAVDGGMRRLVAGEPSTQFAARLRTQIADESASREFIRWRRVLAPAAAIVLTGLATIAAIRVASHQSASLVPPVNIASYDGVQNPVAVESDRESIARKPLTAKKRKAANPPSNQPEVLVPGGQLTLALQLQTALRGGRADGSGLVFAQREIEKPLEIRALAIQPMSAPAEDWTTGLADPDGL
jgi:hypothetical protein